MAQLSLRHFDQKAQNIQNKNHYVNVNVFVIPRRLCTDEVEH
jgi:hypothetical protein